MNNKIIIDVVSGAESKSLVINETRVAGNKAWGGGTIVESFNTTKDRVLGALNIELPQWIPCSERLPEDRKEKLVYLSTNRITVAVYNEHRLPHSGDSIGWGYRVPEGYIDFENETVIAWQPLPEPYKEGKKHE